MNMKNAKKGLSLIEVVFSMFMLFAFVLLLSQSILQIAKNQRASTDVTQAAFLCQNKLEDIRVNRGKDITEGISTENITINGKSSPYVYEIEKKTWKQDSNFWEFIVSVKKFFGGKIVERSFASMAYALPKEASGEGEQFFLAYGAVWPGQNSGTLGGSSYTYQYSNQIGQGVVMYGVRFNPSTNCVEICVFATSNRAFSPTNQTYSAVLKDWTQINPPAPKPIKRLFIVQQEPPLHPGQIGYPLMNQALLPHYKIQAGSSFPGSSNIIPLGTNVSDLIILIQDTDNNLWSAIGNLATLGITDEYARGINIYSNLNNASPSNCESFNFYSRGGLVPGYGSSGWAHPAAGSPWQRLGDLKLR